MVDHFRDPLWRMAMFHCIPSSVGASHMESMACHATSRCRTCEHFEAGVGCALELDIDLALAAPALRVLPRHAGRAVPAASA